MFRRKDEGIVHMIGAFAGIITGFASMWFDFNLYFIVLLMVFLSGQIMLIYTITGSKQYYWWIEILAFILLITGLFIVRV